MATHEPDKEMFDMVMSKIKDLTSALSDWQKKESAIHSLAETHAKSSGAAPEHMDAHVYMHKKAIKKAMAEQMKANSEQGVPSAQDMPGGPMSQVVPGPQGGPGIGGSMTTGPGPLVGPPTGPTPGGQGGPGNIRSPRLPMAGEKGNTGANGWEGLMRPTPYPPQAQQQVGAPTSSTGQTTPAQQNLPGMPVPAAPAGGTGRSPMFMANQGNTLPTASPPLTRPMR